MRVFREEDPMDSGYTVVSNDTLWVDLSCRALGLLVRWLSKPPGVEIDTIQDMITRGKRRGNKRMEGRDALYTASYELEEEGFLVRRLFTNEKGQHEWAAFVRSRPVPREERSDPAGRKRDTAKVRGAAKPPAKAPKRAAKRAPDANPNPGNPFSGLTSNDAESSQVSPVTGFPDSGDPDSENQASSYQSSLHSSLSLQAGGQQQEAAGLGTEEREEAPEEEDDKTRSAGVEIEHPGQEAHQVLAAYEEALGGPALNGTRSRFLADAAELLAARPLWWVIARAQELPKYGTNLAKHAAMSKAPFTANASANPMTDMCPKHPQYHAGSRCIPCVTAVPV